MRVSLLASGSEGNASLFTARDGSTILVDAGLSPRALERTLKELGENLPQALIVTHAHGDHMAFAASIVSKWHVPLFMTEGAARAGGLWDNDGLQLFSPKEPFAIASFIITPLPVPHDSPQVALRIAADGVAASLCTDLGDVPAALPDFLNDADLVLIESNYDLDMLRFGPYPESLKRRVAGGRGHLSNHQTQALLRAMKPEYKDVVLMHLSKTNNRKDLAFGMAHDALSATTRLAIAPARDTMSFEVSPTPRRLRQLQFVF